MVKNFPHLRLIKGEGAELDEGASSFSLLALAELSLPQQRRVERAVAQICPSATLLGVQVTARSWDLRPVILLSPEAAPSVIRFFGPEVTLSLRIAESIRGNLALLQQQEELSAICKIVEWGELEDQLWYRRMLVDTTLVDYQSELNKLGAQKAIAIAQRLINLLEVLHEHKLVHGHLGGANIAFTPSGELALLDPFIASAVIEANHVLGLGAFPPGYLRESFAPEILRRSPDPRAHDIFGLGLVFKDLFYTPTQEQLKRPDLARNRFLAMVQDLVGSMCDESSTRRPTLLQIRQSLELGYLYDPQERQEHGRKTAPTKGVPPKRQVRIRRPTTERQHLELGLDILVEEKAISTEASTTLLEGKQATKAAEPASSLAAEIPATPQVVHPVQPQAAAVSVPLTSPYLLQLITPQRVVAALAIIFVLSFFGRFWLFRSTSLMPEELRSLWFSKTPSLMAQVADEAVKKGEGENQAAELVINSALRGDELGATLDTLMLRTAFDDRWRQQLSSSDERLALAWGLRQLQPKIPNDISDLVSIHPGVVLGMAAGSGGEAFLSKLPATLLRQLPPPLGLAFEEITKINPQQSCAAADIRTLAHLGTRGVEDVIGFNNFIQSETPTKLRALAKLFSQDEPSASRVLTLLLDSPNLLVDHPLIRWGRAFDLLNWKEMMASDKLILLAGMNPAKPLTTARLATLFGHPVTALRALAIKGALDQIRFAHPAAIGVLSRLAKDPDALTPQQTFRLANILEAPAKQKMETINNWLESQPPIELIEELLIASTSESLATKLDVMLLGYLESKGWHPNLSVLRKLSAHPEDSVRIFSYNRIFELSDHETARLILADSFKREKNEDLRKQLRFMLASLSGKQS